jgi:sterol desaturase/sphingolipid hydroxylase (fatty acid hydroxylase superfamily)
LNAATSRGADVKPVDFILSLFDLKTALIMALVFIPLERMVPRRRSQPLRRTAWTNDAVFLVLNGALVRLGLVLGFAAVVKFRSVFMPPAVLAAVGHQPLWLQAIEVFVLADLIYYAVHRLFHEVPFLWRFHAIHHSIEEMDWLASFRIHPLDQIAQAAGSLVPVLALGFSDWVIALYSVIHLWHSLLLHSNVQLRLGRLGLVIATPDFHHWHHSREPEAWDKNFAGQISLFDVIFGTAYLPHGVREIRYGIDEPTPESYVDQLCHPFRKPVEVAAETRGPSSTS